MNKIGKYSTGLKGAAKSAPYVNSNGGYEKRSNEMGTFKSVTPRQRPRPTVAGAAEDVTVHRPKST